MSFISYAKNFEDVILWRSLKHIEKGFYIDVGASDPKQDSVTKAFYDHGWQGLNIDPVSQCYEKLLVERGRDINLHVAVGDKPGSCVLFEIPDIGLSTFDKETAERCEVEHGIEKITKTVQVQSLTEICEELDIQIIHFLKIDVEGAEQQILEGIDFVVIRPWIILVESTVQTTGVESFGNWDALLLANGYEYVYFDGLNRFYIAKEHQNLMQNFELPPNCFDCFSLDSSQVFVKKAIADVTCKQKAIVAGLTDALEVARSNAEYLDGMLGEKIEELSVSSSHNWKEVAGSVSHELHVVYSSKSWRLTRPLRIFYGLLNRVRSALKSSESSLAINSLSASKVRGQGISMEPGGGELQAAGIEGNAGAQEIDLSVVSPNVRSIYKRLEKAVAPAGNDLS